MPVSLPSARLACTNLSVAVAGRPLVTDLNLEIAAGAFVCVLGTNGAGKTLTLHTLAGLRAAASGSVQLGNDLLGELPRREIARRLGLLLQIHDDAFPLTVMDTVLMGRYPHGSFWDWTGSRDRDAVRAALDALDLDGIENRIITSLSGGERERVALATILVQDPAIWLLDEPTNHLDPHHQLIVLNVLRNLANQQRIIVTTVHNPALAMRYADYVLLLFGNGEWEFGKAAELLEPVRLQRMYQTPFDYYRNTSGNRTLLLPA
jgi:iron complex transport system ATP-binding protein